MRTSIHAFNLEHGTFIYDHRSDNSIKYNKYNNTIDKVFNITVLRLHFGIIQHPNYNQTAVHVCL